ncbi:hypothetical protein [Ekhidna sp.]
MNKILFLALFIIISACSVTKSTKSSHQFTGGSVGCGNFIVYKLSEDNTEYVSVAVNARSIDVESDQAYAIGKADIVEVKRKKYAGKVDASLCNDVMIDMPKEELEEVATSGIVELKLSKEELEKAKNKRPYRATVILKNVIFGSLTIDYLYLENIYVGWLPG